LPPLENQQRSGDLLRFLRWFQLKTLYSPGESQALRDNGVLTLGRSESLGAFADLFSVTIIKP
jgi:hypothetical protein